MTEENPTGVSITIKGGTGYDAPWIVLHGADVAHARAMLLELDGSDLVQGTAVVARKFHGTYSGANPAHAAPTQSAPTAPASPAQAASAPPPSFVDNQQAAPAGWSTQQAVATAQQQLGATVVATVPNEVAYCADHGNAPREYKPAGKNRNTGRQYSESYRCAIQGCKAYWRKPDGSWQQ